MRDIYATVAQLVEYDLAKVGVAGSSPVCRSFMSLFLQRLFVLSKYFDDTRVCLKIAFHQMRVTTCLQEYKVRL